MLNRMLVYALYVTLLLLSSSTALASEPIADIPEQDEAKQFLVDAQVFEINRSELRKIGIDFGASQEADGFLSGEQAATVIQLVESLDGKYAKQICQPKLTVFDGQPAKLTVGGEIPVKLPGLSNQSASVTVGISMGVTATETQQGSVNLSVDWKNTELGECPTNEQGSRDVIPCLQVSKCQFNAETTIGEPVAMLGPVTTHQPHAKRGAEEKCEDTIVLMSFRATRVK